MVLNGHHISRARVLAAGLVTLALGTPAGVATAAAERAETTWSVSQCDATGKLADGTTVTVRAEGCTPGKFNLDGTFDMGWTGFNNDWYTPDISGDAKVVSLDNNRNSRGRVTLEFSRPVTNPVLHLADFGGANTNGGPNPSRYSQRWALATPGLTLTRLSGNDQLSVSNGTVQIADVSKVDQTLAGRQGDCSDFDKDGLSYGCGSVQLTGTVTKVAFDVDMRAAKGCCDILREVVSFTVTGPENTAPAAPDAVFGGTAGNALTGKVESADPDGDPVTIRVPDPSKLPPGITIGPDGAVSGTPAKPGTYRVPVEACDDKGACTKGRAVFVIHDCPKAEPDPVETPGDY